MCASCAAAIFRPHKQADIVAQALRGGMAEEALGRAIDGLDASAVVDDDDRIDGRIQQGLQFAVGLVISCVMKRAIGTALAPAGRYVVSAAARPCAIISYPGRPPCPRSRSIHVFSAGPLADRYGEGARRRSARGQCRSGPAPTAPLGAQLRAARTAAGTLEMLVAAAQSASTSSNLQAWSLVAVEDSARKARLAELVGNQAHVRAAPLFLVWLADLARLERSPRPGAARRGPGLPGAAARGRHRCGAGCAEHGRGAGVAGALQRLHRWDPQPAGGGCRGAGPAARRFCHLRNVRRL